MAVEMFPELTQTYALANGSKVSPASVTECPTPSVVSIPVSGIISNNFTHCIG
jgi:hypothetical protein